MSAVECSSPDFTLSRRIRARPMLAVLHVVGAAYVPQLALSRAAAPPRAAAPYAPLVPERLRPLSMAVEGTGPGVGDYVYFVAVLALIPLIVGSVGSSVRLPNGPTGPCHTRVHPLATHASARRSSSSRARTRRTTRRCGCPGRCRWLSGARPWP